MVWNSLGLQGLRCALAILLCLGCSAQESDHAVVLLYHHVDTATPDSTSISPDQFSRHLEFIASESYRVQPLQSLLEQLASGQGVPQGSVAITFDDGYASILKNAAPLLQRRGWPFTVFVNPAQVGVSASYMSWRDLSEIKRMGGEIANHGFSHQRMAYPQPGESPEAWRSRVEEEIESAQEALEDRLGKPPPLFAYPYGEYSPALAALVDRLGYFGIAQHSGAVGFETNLQAIPRHAFHTGADDLSRLKERLLTRPLTIRADPPSGYLAPADYLQLGLKVMTGDFDADRLACYFQGSLLNGVAPPDFSVRIGPLRKGRNMVICTAPSLKEDGYHWWSHLIHHAE